ncbi:Desumoylating isopeptidase 1 [Durusdinium trenchii]|uniref:Desumoylating isopeptidase 1 n=1 Tax=Durusdinium trenchii TaxID=1381693 RepID=A0ABP0L0P1_9DINO
MAHMAWGAWLVVALVLPVIAQNRSLELRVAKALGSKGYDKVRVSMIAQSHEDAADFPFEYREAFQYRWTENVLLSSVLTLTPGPNTLTIDGQEVVIDLPAEDRGIRGVFWADPCFSSRYVNCAFGQTFQTLERSTRMLNAAFEDDSLDLFGVLGDNFYDQSGELTQEFFSRVSLNVKRRFWLMVNGNHDNWVCGFPFCGSSSDDFGIGQMQYYPMDTVASKNDRIFSFDIDPDRNKQWNQFLNNGTNFLFYHKLGNVGFLGYTGAADFAETLPHLHAACEYFAVSQPEVIFLLGHWNNEGLGCSQGMSVPEIHSTLMQIPGCSAFGRRVKYMDGHEHCNYVQAKDEQSAYGFMIGGHGMADAMCAPQYGFAYLDTTGDRIRLYYFEVGRSGVWGIVVGAVLGVLLGALLGFWGVGTAISAMCRSRCTTSRKKRTFAACGVAGAALGGVAGYLLGMYFLNPIFPPQDRFDQIFGCAQANGLHACTHLATLWLDESTQLTRLWM